jgi:two-component system, cell cycle sensor histidine kinase and response regulator CckA
MRSSLHATVTVPDPIFEGYPAPTVIVDLDMRVQLVNRAARSMLQRGFGLADSFLLRRAGDVYACLVSSGGGGCGRERSCRGCVIRSSVREAFTTGDVQRTSTTLRVWRDQHEMEAHFLVSASPVEHGGKRVVVLTVEDVTDVARLKDSCARAERALRETEEQYRNLFESSADAIVALDLDGCFTDANPAALRMLGYSRDELLELTYRDVTPARWHAMNVAIMEGDVRARGCSDEYDKEYVRKDGTVIPVAVRTFTRMDAAGSAVGAWAIVRDVTERKRAEEALSRNEKWFRALIENSNDMIFVLDPDARFTFWSPSAAEALGWTAEEVLGRSRFDLVHPEDAPAIAASTRTRHKDGSWRLVESEGRNLLQDPAVKGIVVNSRDVTEQRRLEDQFRQSQKLESIGQLAGGIAHDFNNLLTVILAGAEALRHELATGAPPDVSILEDIADAGAHARDLTRRLLAFARQQVIAPVTLDLGELAVRTGKLLKRVLRDDIQLTTTVQHGLWPVRSDPGQLEQVILNLAVNARDAMPGGGTLEIEVANVELGLQQIACYPDARPGPHVHLTVRDSGQGMSPEVKARIFEPFFTTKPTGKGTGLGLATVYGIVKQSDGIISVESEPGRGTTFQIFIPRTYDAPAGTASEAPLARARGTETVFVVEDDPQVRAVAVRSLLACGYRVLTAASAREAVELADRELRLVDLLVTDVVMPDLSGPQLANALRRRRPDLRVLMVSGYAPDVVPDRSVVTDFLQKPFTAPSLAERVRAVLDARR